MLINSKIIKNLGGYDEDFFCSDYKLYRVLIDNGIKIKKIRKILYFLNTENNISSLHKIEQKYYKLCKEKKNTRTMINIKIGVLLKVYLTKINESWIIDKMRSGFTHLIPSTTEKIKNADSLDCAPGLQISSKLKNLIIKKFYVRFIT